MEAVPLLALPVVAEVLALSVLMVLVQLAETVATDRRHP